MNGSGTFGVLWHNFWRIFWLLLIFGVVTVFVTVPDLRELAGAGINIIEGGAKGAAAGAAALWP
jgi:hypothetical protein